MADGVGGDLAGEPAGEEILFEFAIDGTDSEAFAILVEKNGFLVDFKESALGMVEIGINPVGCAFGNGEHALFFPLSHDADGKISAIKICAVEAGKFANAES